MALIGYARVSTEDQTLDVQIEQLVAAGCERIFSEKMSGVQLRDRGELAKCMQFIRDGDVLVVTRIDRLARSVVDFHKLMQELDAKGVQFRALLQPFDTTDATGRLLRDILAAFAEFEQQVRKERQMEGIRKAQAEGKYVGRKARGGLSTGKSAVISKYLNMGYKYGQVSEITGVSERTIRKHWPQYNKKPYSRNGKKSKVPYSGPAIDQDMRVYAKPSLPPSASADERDTTGKTVDRKAGLLGRFLRS